MWAGCIHVGRPGLDIIGEGRVVDRWQDVGTPVSVSPMAWGGVVQTSTLGDQTLPKVGTRFTLQYKQVYITV